MEAAAAAVFLSSEIKVVTDICWDWPARAAITASVMEGVRALITLPTRADSLLLELVTVFPWNWAKSCWKAAA